ncbi:hypothetical protein RDI86_02340 [Cellulosimicrobium sp. XJ-DQ-B-000]|uniref:hypothetical protein n=1 Tax=Cellulosimicrobium sp. XJ-DQ-B-000 TaxID=3072182 RepID=UPI0028070D54|nr:hypothetical protein [Cellulosimicrobium sp. XJ-DQ-B-000]MDQ8040681.1 hypothetical protein [Cellulosimicrobium sp. XJ-DQ-B-000]
MAITAVATPVTASTGVTTPRTIALSPHPSTAPGDLVVVFANTQDVSASSMSLPAAWTALLSGQQAGTMRSSIWSKTWQSGDEIILSVSGTDGTVATVITVKGAGQVTVGPVGLRAATGTSLTNVAPGVSTASGSLVLLYSGERTNATEPEPMPAGFANLAWRSGGISGSAPAVSLLASARTADGPVPDTTVSYPNSSAANGLAVMLVIGPAAARGGGSVANLRVSARSGGHRRGRGASFVDVRASARGAGLRRASGGGDSAVAVSAMGAGHRVAAGASVTELTVALDGAGQTRRVGASAAQVLTLGSGAGLVRHYGGTQAAIVVEAISARTELDDFELVLGPGPAGSSFTAGRPADSPVSLGAPVGSPFTIATPRR